MVSWKENDMQDTIDGFATIPACGVTTICTGSLAFLDDFASVAAFGITSVSVS